jgi:hypothetical protein
MMIGLGFVSFAVKGASFEVQKSVARVRAALRLCRRALRSALSLTSLQIFALVLALIGAIRAANYVERPPVFTQAFSMQEGVAVTAVSLVLLIVAFAARADEHEKRS